MAATNYKTFHPKTRSQWRKWLEKNHAISPGIWLVFYKTETGKRKFSYEEAVEEALCFGWIDSLPRKLDDERSMLKYSPRKPNSVWSKINKQRIEQLIKNKLMKPAGLAKIELAKLNGSWDRLNNSDLHANNNTLPPDLEKALNKNKAALNNFKSFSPSYRKQFLYWIDSAKRPQTRDARIKQTVLMAAANKKPGPTGFKL